ncbi:MAG: Eco57I restriction-modification methylase domain-containing protein, partial [Candidatus Poribacteria bacterium]|nr:Eco57I restriction-modification methylase domain-containing protein [Candidatus Poribacteria bacterium]
LMFIYFIQTKGFLDGDLDYLSTKLTHSRLTGVDQYYKAFLCPLFFEGFAKPKKERTREMSRLLGNVPYLNGGIFQKHQIEAHHGERIQIPDAAFEQLFDFFKGYRWHLDDRPLKKDNEINPDVLGYIFEKYINQKQMGAYYTKEDITEYISKNTIIPFLLDTARKNCKIAFEPPTDANTAAVWQLLRNDPDRYIYDAVKHGVEHELPPEIAAGIEDVSARSQWNTLASPEYCFPTEIWREVVARRERYEEIRAKLSNGDIHEVDDLITYNLNIRQFAQDIIENCEGPDLLRAIWKAIKAVTILDPTCGSGAFLFAALNILEPLYEACLDRMGSFVDELSVAAEKPHPKKYSDFRADLDRIKEHPNPTYFILKSIIVNNLYGVDIMEEAIEICKLRLFLKMVAQIEDVNEIEPLPDIDFNIQAGNALVGYATYEEAEKAITGKFDFDNTMRRIRESAEDIDALFGQFRLQQLVFRGDVTPATKRELQGRLHELEGELNRYLAGEYQVDSNNEEDYQKWITSHKPFHWFVEFYGILEKDESDMIKKCGFDVIIGNPPYVEYGAVKKEYTIRGYKTESCGNLYAFVMERLMALGRKNGRCGMIVPLSGHSTDRMKPLAKNYYSKVACLHLVNISGDAHPSVLFSGVNFRLYCRLANVALFYQ